MERGETLSSPTTKPAKSKERPRPTRPSAYWQKLQSLVHVRPSFNFKSSSVPPNLAEPSSSVSQLKIRVISWNMHDSIPKGNIAELLGSIPKYTPVEPQDCTHIPSFEPGDCHPYHIVIVAGQECPTVSGIPLGLAGFKLKDRDRERRIRLSAAIHKHISPVVSELGIAAKDALEVSPNELPVIGNNKNPQSNSHSQLKEHHHQTTSGWSYILEDWFCRGVGALNGVKPVLYGNVDLKADGIPSSPSTPSSSQSQTIGVSWQTEEAASASDSHITSASDMGSYELLLKDRLMGIYLAVFIHRELRPFVRGASKGSVAAGLMGGRIGNKGGVGISVNVNGTRLLFINAHLAAHEDHVALRVANFTKIKTELSVDTFLPPDDARNLSEDITDRFDHTFVFGDLNFRLDLSRLHADWLIAQKDYSQALKFDQLRKVMECKQSFTGFEEADIDFPPTYKFDVLKTIKSPKSKRRYSMKEMLKEAFTEPHNEDDRDIPHNDDRKRKPFYGVEASSMVSSVFTDSHSRAGTITVTEGEDDDAEEEAHKPSTSAHSLNIPGLHHWLPTAWRRKAQLLAEYTKSRPASNPAIQSSKSSPSLSPSPPSTSFPQVLPPTPSASQDTKFVAPASKRLSVSTSNLVAQKSNTKEDAKPSKRLTGKLSNPHSGHDGPSADEFPQTQAEEKEIEAVIYDSSSKQRVPSWCDRILWKTTIKRGVGSPASSDVPGRRNASAKRWSNFWTGLRSPSRTSSTSTASNISKEGIVPNGMASINSDINGSVDSQAAPVAPAVQERRTGKSPLQIHKFRSLDIPSGGGSKPIAQRSVSMEGEQSRGGSMPLSNPLVPTRANRRVSDPPTSPWYQTDSPTTAPTRPWFLSLLSPRRDGADTATAASDAVQPLSQEPPRRGDVVCLHYGTLDDTAMRRLEGRSDHRPIVGSYSLYI